MIGDVQFDAVAGADDELCIIIMPAPSWDIRELGVCECNISDLSGIP